MTILEDKFPELYMGYHVIGEAAAEELGMIMVDDDLSGLVGKCPAQKVKNYRGLSTAGWTPVVVGRVVEPAELSEFYVVEWYQGMPHPFTLVDQEDFVDRPSI